MTSDHFSSTVVEVLLLDSRMTGASFGTVSRKVQGKGYPSKDISIETEYMMSAINISSSIIYY